MLLFLGFIVLTVLFVMSAVWSGAETALSSLSKYRIKKLIAINKPLSALLGQWLKAPYYLLSTILIGNTTNDLILSGLSTYIVLQVSVSVFHIVPRGVVEFFTWLLVTFVLLIFGEITPKVFSRMNPEKVTITLLPFLTAVMKLSKIIIWPFTAPIKLLFPKLSLVPVGRLTYISLEEIHGLISEANDSGMLAKDTSTMLERVLKLGELKVSQIMTPISDIEAVNLYQDEEKFLDMVVETGRSRVPVYNSSLNKIAGFVHTKDILWCWKKNNECFSREVIRPPYFVPPEKKVSEIIREFQSGRTHIAFVADAIGNVLGLVTLEDVLEEIVGEILDEYDLKREDDDDNNDSAR
ncbi:MAG: HlyC/CorC family transporter [Endomicrobiales bacterium]|nr:HlyC/CorC family transporter [Endomicrobiales bacterium]